jgi:hypothetical protein
MAHNEVDNIVYIGKGDDGTGNATSVVPIGGAGHFVDRSTAQDLAGKKTFTAVPSSSADAVGATDLVRKSQHDLKASLVSPDLTGNPTAPTQAEGDDTTKIASTAFVKLAVAASSSASAGPIENVTLTDATAGELLVKTPSGWENKTLAEAGIHAVGQSSSIAQVTGLQGDLDLKAPLVSPALSGTPTVPTASGGTSTNQVANAAFVQQELASLVSSAPGTLDTLNELAAALGDDPNFATTMSTSFGLKMVKTANLSDLENFATSRANLGLLSMAVQAASAVAITGGSINGVILDGGSF